MTRFDLILVVFMLLALSIIWNLPPAKHTHPSPTESCCQWVGQLEMRVNDLEQEWLEHDKTYHFTCAPEDCLTVDELLKWRRNEPN